MKLLKSNVMNVHTEDIFIGEVGTVWDVTVEQDEDLGFILAVECEAPYNCELHHQA